MDLKKHDLDEMMATQEGQAHLRESHGMTAEEAREYFVQLSRWEDDGGNGLYAEGED
jgi:hypothetical protein